MQLNKHFKNGILTAIILLVSSFSTEHKFYLSVSEVNFNKEKATFEIIGRYFIDDVQEVLQMRYENNLSLDPEQLTPKIDFYLEKMKLQNKANIKAKFLSGGEKRKQKFSELFF